MVAGGNACSHVWALSGGSDSIGSIYGHSASSGSSVLVAVARKRKTIGIWVARRQFWVRINNIFAALLSTVGNGGHI